MDSKNKNHLRIFGADTADGLLTFDRQTVDSAGAFLIGELERLDPQIHLPLVDIRWWELVDVRDDVGFGDEISSYTMSSFASAGGAGGGRINWIGKTSSAVPGVVLDIGKISSPLGIWGQEVSWTIPELMSAQQAGRPVDTQKIEGMQLKYQMDVDQLVSIGDSTQGYTGLFNASRVSNNTNATTGSWLNPATTPDQVLEDINEILTSSMSQSVYAVTPTTLVLPGAQFGALSTRKVSQAGNISVLKYIAENCVTAERNGKPLEIKLSKWLAGAGASGADRMMAYTKRKDLVRYPMTALLNTPVQNDGLYQKTTYWGRLGMLEVVRPETIAYRDGI